MEGEKGYKKGLWTEEEDRILIDYIRVNGEGKWNRVAKITGLKRCGKSCRLRWINYLSPSIKHGEFSEEEDDLIIRLHNLLGNRWSLIAGRVPGRTDNQVKNHWNTHLSKKLGLKKERTKVNGGFGASAKLAKNVSSTTVVPLDTTLTSLNLTSSNTSNVGEHDEDQVVIIEEDDDFKSKIGLFRVEEEAMEVMNNGGCESPLWFSNDDFNLNPPSLMELLDHYSFDHDEHFVNWHG